MSTPSSILILEDSRMSALLLVKTLQQEGFTFEHKIVDNEKDLDQVLSEASFDLVLSDYYMPELDCGLALQKTRSRNPDIPFVIVSGKIGEETVVEMMRKGATDFVMKDRMDRLVPVVHRELRNIQSLRERQNTQERLRRTEEQFRGFVSTILEVIPDGLLVLDGKRNPFLINASFHQIVRRYAAELGYSEDELRELLIKRSLEQVESLQSQSKKGAIELRIERKSQPRRKDSEN
ncbi:MAG: response regulator [Leptospiraceae bacterium]|nr:response regulator [Leptospiraceae bacterium]